jgi:hypothetical protein
MIANAIINQSNLLKRELLAARAKRRFLPYAITPSASVRTTGEVMPGEVNPFPRR